MSEFLLSEAEAFVMEHFWKKGPLKTEELAPLVAEKGWKSTTLLTFLSRLAAKGMLLVTRQGKANLYTPLVSRAEYQRAEGTAFLNQMYGGSAKNFLAAMVDTNGLTSKDIAELKLWLEQQEGEPNE
ncbi:MAG: BlaI/MecI/CopY family transcriptional regulator [Oscillospiraceae bacterium]